jgi:glucose-1-phosphate thymidylyltransferase
VKGPCVIGSGVLIEKSSIGPYTSIGNGSKVINSHVESAIILEGTIIQGIQRLEESLVGRNARIQKSSKKGLRVHLGDYSEIEV